MSWRVAKSLLKMRDQINAMAPRRNKSSDGTIGDAKHASRSSDHNPWVKDGKTGIVTAIDITHDPSNGCHMHNIAEYMRTQKDPRIKYCICNRRIYSSVQSPWQWRKYTGSNPHISHVHFSVHSTKGHYDSEAPWRLAITAPILPPDPDAPATRPVLRLNSRGEHVQEVQTLLAVKADAVFGPITETAVKNFQTSRKLVADGIVGPRTWAALDKIEQRNDGEHEGDLFEE